MSFLQRNKNSLSKSRIARLLFGAVLLAAITFSLNYITGGSISALVRAPLAPFASFEKALQSRLDAFMLSFRNKGSLLKENEALKEQLANRK